MELSQGSAINGYAVVKGTTRIAGAGSATKGLFSFGNVTLENSAVIDGDLHTLGDVYMNGSAWVKGNLQADGSLTMLNGRIDQNATLGGALISVAAAKLYGSLVLQLKCHMRLGWCVVIRGGGRHQNNRLHARGFQSLYISGSGPLSMFRRKANARNVQHGRDKRK